MSSLMPRSRTVAKLCPGTDVQPATGDCPSFNEKFPPQKCTLFVKDDARGACVHCKYQRKLILNQLSRPKCRKMASRKSKTTNMRRAVRRMKVKLRKAQMSLDQTKAKNEQLPEEILIGRIRCFPSKQQDAVQACFEAARKKSKKGTRYDNKWHLECILM